MSGASSSLGAAGEGFRPPFTAAQWRELEHQALVYKYLVEGVPVPAELLVPIRQSFESMSARFFPHSSLGYFSYYGKKMDPEPGRCRRTDGKKWRCSKDAYPGSKYCERHMHRGRNRSRKPVESQSTSQSLLTVMSQSGTGSSSGSSSFKNLPLQSMVNQDSLLGNSASKLQTEPVSNAMDNKEYRYLHGLKPEGDEHGFHPEGPGSFQVLGMDQNVDNNTWHLMPSSVQVNRFPNPSYGAYLKSGFCQPNIGKDFESMSTPATSKQRQPHYFFGREVGSSGPVKQESHAARPFLDDWPRARDSWPELDDQGYDKKSSSTQLSISVPTPLSEISTASACSPNELGAED